MLFIILQLFLRQSYEYVVVHCSEKVVDVALCRSCKDVVVVEVEVVVDSATVFVTIL